MIIVAPPPAHMPVGDFQSPQRIERRPHHSLEQRRHGVAHTLCRPGAPRCSRLACPSRLRQSFIPFARRPHRSYCSKLPGFLFFRFLFIFGVQNNPTFSHQVFFDVVGLVTVVEDCNAISNHICAKTNAMTDLIRPHYNVIAIDTKYRSLKKERKASKSSTFAVVPGPAERGPTKRRRSKRR